MLKPETTFTKSILRYLPLSIYHMKNNNQYVGGIPDLWISGTKSDLWLEMKFLPKTPLRAIVKPAELLSPLQLRWLNGRYVDFAKSKERTVAMVIGCPDGGIILRNQEWLKEFTPQLFRDRLVPRQEIAQWIAATVAR